MTASSIQPITDIGLLALPDSTPAALYGLYEVLASVGVVWQALTGEPAACEPLRVRILSEHAEPFTCAGGVPIAPHAGMADVDRVDLVIVADLAVSPDEDPRGRWPAAADWLRRQHAAGATICSVCTGAILLADAGLLDDLEATTHWSVTGLFRDYFPSVRLHPERIVLAAGPEQRIVTSGGAASWEDLALYLIARCRGEAEAVRAAKVFVLGDRSEGQLLYAAVAKPRRHEDAVIAAAQAWIAEHYTGESPVARMGEQAGLGERTFKRRFKAATGYAPMDYVHRLRIEEAKQLLESTATATDEIARQVGYRVPTFFRRLFKRRTGVTPARYRQRFRAIGGAGVEAGVLVAPAAGGHQDAAS
jgi:transcriptional regulator GlxA family with amidase domain